MDAEKFRIVDAVARWAMMVFGFFLGLMTIVILRETNSTGDLVAMCAASVMAGIVATLITWLLYLVIFPAGVPIKMGSMTISPGGEFYRLAVKRHFGYFILAFATMPGLELIVCVIRSA